MHAPQPPLVLIGGESLVDLIVDAAGAIEARVGGAPANVARGVARLGGRSAFLGAVSGDRFGRELRAALAEDGVEDGGLVATDAPTTLALAELDATGAASYRFYLAGTAAPALEVERALAAADLDPAAVYVGGLALGLEPIGPALEALVGAVGDDVLVMVDPNARPGALPDPAAHPARFDRLLGRTDVVKVSVEDLAELVPGVAAEAAATGLLERGPGCVLVTDGPRPTVVLTARGRRSIPVPEVVVRDTVGAGDAFSAGMLAWWTTRGLGRAELADLDRLEAAATWATRVAAKTCERAGAQPPRLAELG